MSALSRRSLLSALFASAAAPVCAQDPLKPGQEAVGPVQPSQPQLLRENRYGFPIRLGGVFTMGLGEKGGDLEESARSGTPLSDEKRRWLLATCDVAAFSTRNVTPATFPALTKAQPLFTPLLHFYASTLSETEGARGSVGGWRPGMRAWVLKNEKGEEVPHPDAASHWMDFGDKRWAAHWREQAAAWVAQYGAQGVVAAELPLGNTFVGEGLGRLARPADRAEAAEAWLKAARDTRDPKRYFLIPSTLGFDALAGHPTQPTPPGTEQPQLTGRLWDQFHPYIDGGWAEGWVRPYWADGPLPEAVWELHVEAADRAARNGQIFIAAAAYTSGAELEFALASYLLAAHRQGRCVFQPMPLLPFARPDAGHSLAVQKRAVTAHTRLFNAPLGAPVQERHLIPAGGGSVWRRAFTHGVVYVNSSERDGATLALGGEMERARGGRVRALELGPQSGAILLYNEKPKT